MGFDPKKLDTQILMGMFDRPYDQDLLNQILEELITREEEEKENKKRQSQSLDNLLLTRVT